MAVWNPWTGCHKKSEGCVNCYIHRANYRKGINTDNIIKIDEFYKPVMIERFIENSPEDFYKNYSHVTVACTIENQKRADERLSIFIKDGKTYNVKRQLLCAQAREANINFQKK